MFFQFFKNTVFLVLVLTFSCSGASQNQENSEKEQTSEKNTSTSQAIIVGANRTSQYLDLLKDKKVGVVGNQTSVIFKEKEHIHLVDSLLNLDVNITKVFSPEHGFRGTASAGELVDSEIDKKTGLPIVSLYGSNRKPKAEDLKDVDLLVFDIQDVGLRFYTYISTLHYVMEAAAEQDIPIVVLDRPNPNGHYIDGPILEEEHKSFVGMHPVPVVHGLTIAEYAQMVNGEQWLKNGVQTDLTVIKMKNYIKGQTYSLPIKPSPNLPNDKSINLYSSLCFFEGTNVNAGRGTDLPFQVFGSPTLDSTYYEYSYIPKSNEGAKNPKHEGETCYGKNLRFSPYLEEINLEWLIEAYQHTENPDEFFIPFFEKLAGTDQLRTQIEAGLSEKEIKRTWEAGLTDFRKRSMPYLLY
ncbi:MAG TPA: DUF1343 domain-containing protein [Flavobacteriaceae bacterium]|nr:DUF1343 domain-containing protein [Flavobacteriaceae bacterium]